MNVNRDKIIEIAKEYSGLMDTGDNIDEYEMFADEILASQWISVEDELPEEGKGVLVHLPNLLHPYSLSYLMSTGKWACEYIGRGTVTHWMPLPAPPETHES